MDELGRGREAGKGDFSQMNLTEYIERYAQHHKIYWAGGVPWRRYKGVLRPLSLPHIEPKLERKAIKQLLRESKCAFAMWTYEFDSSKSEWWWIIAEKPYVFERLPSKARYNIRHGLKNSKVEMISGKILADIGYDCYQSAMRRHTQTEALDEAEFRRRMPDWDADGAHEIWGVFVGGRLAGFAVYLVIDKVVNQLDAIFDPSYFRNHSSHALIHTITDYYLNQRNSLYITTGMRSISHETEFEDFVIKNFGYRKAYCKLGLKYASPVRVLSRLIYKTSPVWKRVYLPRRLRNRLEILYKLKSIENGHDTASRRPFLDSTLDSTE